MPIEFATVEEAVEELRQGRQIVLVDDEDRENEGDLAMVGEKITPEQINFMAKFGRGLICLALTEDRCDELHLPPMTPVNTSAMGRVAQPLPFRVAHLSRRVRKVGLLFFAHAGDVAIAWGAINSRKSACSARN